MAFFSLGHQELANLSPALVEINLENNSISAVSNGALAGLFEPALIKFAGNPTVCMLSLVKGSADLNCTCAPGFANESPFTSYCGAFGRCRFSV